MTSFPLPGGQGDGQADWTNATFDDVMADAERALARQRRRVRRMRSRRRREALRKTAHRTRVCGRRTLFVIGTTAFVTGMVYLSLDGRDIALELFKVAIAAWAAAAAITPPPQP